MTKLKEMEIKELPPLSPILEAMLKKVGETGVDSKGLQACSFLKCPNPAIVVWTYVDGSRTNLRLCRACAMNYRHDASVGGVSPRSITGDEGKSGMTLEEALVSGWPQEEGPATAEVKKAEESKNPAGVDATTSIHWTYVGESNSAVTTVVVDELEGLHDEE